MHDAVMGTYKDQEKGNNSLGYQDAQIKILNNYDEIQIKIDATSIICA